jgi:hypothetical protein
MCVRQIEWILRHRYNHQIRLLRYVNSVITPEAHYHKKKKKKKNISSGERYVP